MYIFNFKLYAIYKSCIYNGKIYIYYQNNHICHFKKSFHELIVMTRDNYEN